MKKMIFAVMLSAALVTFGGISAIAAPSSCMKGCNRINFVDTNGDGICDNHGTNCSIGFVDDNGDGICDHRISQKCSNFVDNNGDGICDNHGINCGIGFVDENGDGICDHRASANTTAKQNGMGRRGCHNNMNGHGCHQAK